MHKGKITMLGRIMAGSQAVIAHDDSGPGRSLWRIIRPTCMCLRSLWPTASRWPWPPGASLFVIDRAVNAVALARAFDDAGLGLAVHAR